MQVTVNMYLQILFLLLVYIMLTNQQQQYLHDMILMGQFRYLLLVEISFIFLKDDGNNCTVFKPKSSSIIVLEYMYSQ